MSDKLFKGRRAPAGILFMIGVFIAVLVYWLNPPGNPMVDSIALVAIDFNLRTGYVNWSTRS